MSTSMGMGNEPNITTITGRRLDVDPVVRSIPQGTLQAGKSFSVACALDMASVLGGQQRILGLAV